MTLNAVYDTSILGMRAETARMTLNAVYDTSVLGMRAETARMNFSRILTMILTFSPATPGGKRSKKINNNCSNCIVERSACWESFQQTTV